MRSCPCSPAPLTAKAARAVAQERHPLIFVALGASGVFYRFGEDRSSTCPARWATPTAQVIPSLVRHFPALQGRSWTPDRRQAGGILAFANKAATATHQPPRRYPRHAHPCRGGGLNRNLIKQEFESVCQHKDELEWLFMELYHNRGRAGGGSGAGDGEAYNARSAELKALDKARSADPEWYKRGNMFRHDHVHRPLCRKSERTGKEAALPQGAEADLSAPDAPAADAPPPQRWRLSRWRISIP